MFRRSRIPLNSTDPSILEELLERQQQPSLTTPNTLRFMIPPESPSHSSTQHPQPRLKSLIKLDHLLRPSPSLRLAGPRRVLSEPTPARTKPIHQRSQSTPRNPILKIDGLKSRFSVQVSDSEYLSQEDQEDQSTSQLPSQNYSTSSSSSSSYSSLSSSTISSTHYTSSSSSSASCIDQPNLPLKLSTDSHPHRLLNRKTTPASSHIITQIKNQNQATNQSITSLPKETPTTEFRNPPEQPAPKHHSNFSSVSTRLPPTKSSPRRRSLSPSKGKSRSFLPEEEEAEEEAGRGRRSTKTDQRNSLKRTHNNHRPDYDHQEPDQAQEEVILEPIKTKGLSAFIRPIKYGLLQLASSSSRATTKSINKAPSQNPFEPLHLRLWITNHHHALFDPIPANLIVISPNGDQIELLYTEEEVNERSTEEDLRRSYSSATLKVIFYSLEALPIELRRMYNYLTKLMMIVSSNTPRAVFQLHTPVFQQRVRCALMLNTPVSDLQLDYSSLTNPSHLKIKLSLARSRIKLWIDGNLLSHPHDSPFPASNDPDHTSSLAGYLVSLLKDSAFPAPDPHRQSINQGNIDPQFQDFLDFIHPCLVISNQIQRSLDQA
ncbi:hypothetical protein PGT21_007183 [Puccinia graminis f. sp. tritici]|uniref:Uncharacterized protein n=1 Tax=Puccinia graminis f. sp. tritici TaxID=56615 RepID=A0A5B0MAG5_PUCGR|nr:hypothetical protein PGTUg99_027754 [Puccinia graminis f. sp. tritici]KAA1090618.1 hypothetical protein PGT21_007183 [Puccinia graminis f. sp. tritici]